MEAISLSWIVILLLLHLIGDFFLQTHWMATNKHFLGWPLVAHGMTYIIPFFVVPLVLGMDFLAFVFLNASAHAAVDSITSQITHHFHEKKDYHNFFVTIGIDQFVHFVIMFTIFICVGSL